MILDISTYHHITHGHSSFELIQDGVEWFSANIGQYIESSTVGHAQDAALHSKVTGLRNSGIHRRNKRLSSVKSESMHGGILTLQELLKPTRSHDVIENVTFQLQWKWV